ncbi:pyruvate dehydrogenase E1 component beta subunit [Myxococcaceae bacterium]|jgi:pyruvate dehydrogenase E1 component beta subunit|nr:pyruvate dehydrogenase E1 component beta subunit [Myxococcaceae bacterium]
MREIRYFEALNEALAEEMRRDPDVFLMGEDIGLFGGTFRVTEHLLAEFGAKRVRDTPIAEAGIVGLAIGAAMGGLRPVPELMTMNFAIVAMDQIINHAAKLRYMFGGQLRLPITLRAAGGGGTQKGAQHSHSIESWFVNSPGIRVVIPSTPSDAKGLLKTSIRSDDVVLFIEHEMLYSTKGAVPDGEHLVPLGVADVKRRGSDVTIVAWSKMVHEALRAADALAVEGIEAEVLDPRTLDPFDWEALHESVARTRRCVVAEEGWRTVGVGAEIAARLQERFFYELDAPVQRVGAVDVPTPYAKGLEQAALPHADDIVRAVLKITT